MRVGYARNALCAPIIHAQIETLKLAGCQKIFTSMRSLEKADIMKKIKSFIREGEDTVLVYSLICLDKPIKELVMLFHQFDRLQLSFESVEDRLIIDKTQWDIAFNTIDLHKKLNFEDD